MIPSQLEARLGMEPLSEGYNQLLAQRVLISRMALVISLTALAYDYLLSVNDEVELIWPSRFSMVKILFLLNRYLPFVGISGLCYVFLSFDVSNHSQHCVPLFWIFGSFIFVEYYVSELILFTRAYAVWGVRSGKILPILIGCLVMWFPALYYGIKFLRSAEVFDASVFPSGCLVSLNGHYDILAMIDLLVSETVAILAILIKAAQLPSSMIMRRISSDGALFFAVTLAATIANIIVLKTTPPEICNFLLAPQAALHSICCNRLLLRIRKVAAHTEYLCETIDITSPQESLLPGDHCTPRQV